MADALRRDMPATASGPKDRHGNPIDPVVGFARGRIITSSVQEAMRLRHGQAIAAERVRRLGPHSIGVFTGNQRDFPVRPDDLATYCEEWVGPGLFAEELRAAAISHMGGEPTDDVAVFNRTSAGIVATIAAHAGGAPVVSVVPEKGRSHASVTRGCGLARVGMLEVQADGDWRAVIAERKPRLVVVTTVTSGLERLPDDVARAVVEAAKAVGAIAFLDEAYGARLRTVLHGGAPSLKLGGDVAITNCDKAGMAGPRAGVLVGRPALVTAAQAKGSEYGMEARAPIAAGALRSLQSFSAAALREEAASGQRLAAALEAGMGESLVKRSDLGPMVHEDDVLDVVMRRAGKPGNPAGLVPCEVTSALGMLLLRDHGVLTVNTHGQPGARVSLRLKPTLDALDRVGGIDAVVDAIDASIGDLADVVADPAAVATLITGERA